MDDLTKTQLSLNVEALQAEVDQLRHDASHDKLTGLPNRRGFDDRAGKDGLYIAIDLNNFKRLQDRHELKHEFGDLVLVAFARFLVANVRETDRVPCRKGGDEFILWCPTYLGALKVKKRLHEWSYCGVTASVGIGRTPESADVRMYEDKLERTRPWWRKAVFAFFRRTGRLIQFQEKRSTLKKAA